MNIKNKIINIGIVVLFCSLFLTGCGYKPSAKNVREVLQDNIYVQIRIDNEDPKNSVLIKDSLLSIIKDRFHANVVDKKELADTILTIKLGSVSMSSIQHDSEGYVSLYRASVRLNLTYENDKGTKTLTRLGTEDFPINAGNLISESKRFEVIKTASSNALEDMIPFLAVQAYDKTPEDVNDSK